MLFGRAKPKGKTVLILDIESGSVGAALARVGDDGALSLLGEYRRHLPVRSVRGAGLLAADIEKLAAEAIMRMSELAARLRTEGSEPSAGEVSQAAIFMAPPWGKPNLELGKPEFVPHLTEVLQREVSPYFEVPTNFYTNAGAATAGVRTLAPHEDKFLLCIVTHEMTELLLINNGAVAGHATIPHGINLPLRTLKAHGGLSDAEARSALSLGHLHEPLASATQHYNDEFRSAASELFRSYAPQNVWVISPMGEHFARSLSHESLSDLFPEGGVVRALRPHHAQGHLAAPHTDLFLILEAIFIRYT